MNIKSIKRSFSIILLIVGSITSASANNYFSFNNGAMPHFNNGSPSGVHPGVSRSTISRFTAGYGGELSGNSGVQNGNNNVNYDISNNVVNIKTNTVKNNNKLNELDTAEETISLLYRIVNYQKEKSLNNVEYVNKIVTKILYQIDELDATAALKEDLRKRVYNLLDKFNLRTANLEKEKYGNNKSFTLSMPEQNFSNIDSTTLNAYILSIQNFLREAKTPSDLIQIQKSLDKLINDIQNNFYLEKKDKQDAIENAVLLSKIITNKLKKINNEYKNKHKQKI